MTVQRNAENDRCRCGRIAVGMKVTEQRNLNPDCPIHGTRSADTVRHVLVESPSWDTKQRCACGAEFVSRCEMWKHQADAYLLLIDGEA